MKTGGTSGKKNFVFTFHSVCTVFVLFKMGYFQSSLIVRDLHNCKVVPYGWVEVSKRATYICSCPSTRTILTFSNYRLENPWIWPTMTFSNH